MIIWEKTKLFTMQGTLNIKKEELVQLKNCETELKGVREEFNDSKSSIKKPGLSAKTWQGSLADSFKDVRNDMKSAYDDICGKQFDDLFEKLNEGIKSLNSEIDSLGKDISSLHKKIEKLEKEAKKAHH
ncbi:YwqH-like family protein [Bacillus sp. JJ675]|uniref:YwqH-like family protein n=1 Tax=Bacillus sp. JJ675 TaxID=3122972 RepID=UPI0030006CAA